MPRLDILLARNLGWSRAAARAAVDEGRVAVRGVAVRDARLDVAPAELPLAVTVDDEPALLFDSARVMLNKPIGCVTALRDPRHPTAYALAGGRAAA